jgi:hypothetical protein
MKYCQWSLEGPQRYYNECCRYSSRKSRKVKVQKLNRSRKDFQSRTTLCRDKDGRLLSNDEAVLQRWAQYFDELINGNVFEHLEGMTIVQNQRSPEVEEPVSTISEVREQAIKRLENNKAPGMDLIQEESIKYAGPEYVKHLYQLMVKI